MEQKFVSRRIAVLIPEVVKRHWYQYLLHARYADHLRRQLLRDGDSRLIVIDALGDYDGKGGTRSDCRAPRRSVEPVKLAGEEDAMKAPGATRKREP